jgi:Ca2+-binding EF-hand superfamily protein
LKNKLAQKASGVQNEETVLLRAFKYFDLNNNNTVEPEEFAKAIEKIGIMIPTRQVRVAGFCLLMMPVVMNL